MNVIEGRWQDALPGSYDPERAVVITDPPYGLEATSGTANGSHGRARGRGQVDGRDGHATAKGYADDIPWARHVEEVLALLPAKRHVIRGPATTLIRRDYPQPRRVCIELAAYRRRAACRPGVVPYLWQGWAIYGRLKIERHRTPPRGDGLFSPTILQRHEGDKHGAMTRHKALTPFSSAVWIIDTWADPGMLVLDPFAGLGTIGLAARTLGFDYIGAELVPEYAETANRAFLDERLTLGLAG